MSNDTITLPTDKLLHWMIVVYDCGRSDEAGEPALAIADTTLAAYVNLARAAHRERMQRRLPPGEPAPPAWLRSLQEDRDGDG